MRSAGGVRKSLLLGYSGVSKQATDGVGEMVPVRLSDASPRLTLESALGAFGATGKGLLRVVGAVRVRPR